MSNVQDLATIEVHFKKQSALGSAAAGAGGSGIEVLPSTGLASQIASIEDAMIHKSRMRRRARHGMESVTAAYETQLSVGSTGAEIEEIVAAVLGCTAVAEQSFSEADWGAVAITGTGVTATFASGTLRTDGIVAGNFIRFTNLSVTGNNGKWVPIIDVPSEGVLTFAPGYLLDNTSDVAYTVEIAKSYKTPTTYVNTYYSLEEYLPELTVPSSKYGTDCRFNSLNFDISAGSYVKVGFGAGGREQTMVAGPVLTGAVYKPGNSLILLDGGLFVNGIKRTDLTSMKFGLAAPVTGLAVIGTSISPDVFLGQFAFTGDFTGAMIDDTEFQAFKDEDDIAILLHCKDKETEAFVGIYVGYTSYAGYSSPAGGEGAALQTIPLYGGEDTRGAGFAATTMLFSVSPD